MMEIITVKNVLFKIIILHKFICPFRHIHLMVHQQLPRDSMTEYNSCSFTLLCIACFKIDIFV